MKFRLAELKSMEPVLSKIMESTVLSIRVAYRFSKFLKTVAKELQTLEDTRQMLVKKYGEDDSDGNTKVKDASIQEFIDGLNDVLNEEVDISIEPVALDDLGSLSLSPAEVMVIERLIQDPS